MASASASLTLLLVRIGCWLSAVAAGSCSDATIADLPILPYFAWALLIVYGSSAAIVLLW